MSKEKGERQLSAIYVQYSAAFFFSSAVFLRFSVDYIALITHEGLFKKEICRFPDAILPITTLLTIKFPPYGVQEIFFPSIKFN